VFGLLSLAVPAAVAAHCVGYELAALGQRSFGPLTGGGLHDGHAVGSHAAHLASAHDVHAAHLPLVPLTTGALVVGALVLGSAVIGGRRAVGVAAPRLGALVAAQFGVVAVIELTGAAAGMSPPAEAVVLALALQFPVAVAMVQLARSTRRLLVRLLRAGVRPGRRRPVPLAPGVVVDLAMSQIWSSHPPGRGPPAGMVH